MQNIVKRIHRLEKKVYGEYSEEFRSIDKRFQGIEHRLDRVDSRLEHIDFRLGGIESDVKDLKSRLMGMYGLIENQTRWVAGVMMGLLLTIVTMGVTITLKFIFL